MANLTKAGIADAVYARMGDLTKIEALALVEAVFQTMKDAVVAGHRVKLHGFGNFEPRNKRERPGLDPRTRTPIVIAPHRIVRFKCSPVLRGIANSE